MILIILIIIRKTLQFSLLVGINKSTIQKEILTSCKYVRFAEKSLFGQQNNSNSGEEILSDVKDGVNHVVPENAQANIIINQKQVTDSC